MFLFNEESQMLLEMKGIQEMKNTLLALPKNNSIAKWEMSTGGAWGNMRDRVCCSRLQDTKESGSGCLQQRQRPGLRVSLSNGLWHRHGVWGNVFRGSKICNPWGAKQESIRGHGSSGPDAGTEKVKVEERVPGAYMPWGLSSMKPWVTDNPIVLS